MSVDVLRRAAALMRERAEQIDSACPMPWRRSEPMTSLRAGALLDATGAILTPASPVVQAYFASWHPAVALSAADLLDAVARMMDMFAEAGIPADAMPDSVNARALTIARVYLGETP